MIQTYAVDFLKDEKRVAREYVTALSPIHAQIIAERTAKVEYDGLEVNPL